MSGYLVVSWTCAVITTCALAVTLASWPWLLVKPSLWTLIAHNVLIQWAAVMSAERIYLFLPSPWPFALLVHGFPLLAIAGTIFTFRTSAWETWQRLPTLRTDDAWMRAVAILSVGIVLTMGYYFRVIPFADTGLYALLFNPAVAQLAREESLKLVQDPIARYGLSLVISVAAPLLGSLLVWRVLDRHGDARRRALLSALVGVSVLLMIVTVSGARSYAAILLVTLACALAFRVRFAPRFLLLLPLAVIVPAVPTVLTIVREGVTLDVPTFATYLRSFILERIFYGPLDTGLWYAHYGQSAGHVGVAGIPKLAALLHEPTVNMPNLIGTRYMETSLDSIHANTGFIFAYYGYFGIVSLPISLLLFWSIDSVLIILRRLGDTMLAGSVAAVALGGVGFIVAEYTTVLVTHGFALLPVAAFVLDRLTRSSRAPWAVAPSPSVT